MESPEGVSTERSGYGLLRWLHPVGADPDSGPSPESWRWAELACLVLLVVHLVFILTFSSDYGLTWDEPRHRDHGRLVIEYFLSGGSDAVFDHYEATNMYIYGPLWVAFAEGVRRLFDTDLFETMHLLGGLLGLIGVLGCFKLGTSIAGPRAGFGAALLLATTPAYLGHSFANLVDAPLAVAQVWALYYLAALARGFSGAGRGLVVRLGLTIGAALSMRIPSVFLLGYLGLLAIGDAWLADRPRPGFRLQLWANVRRVCLPATALAVMLPFAVWPWLHRDPIGHLFGVFFQMSDYTDWPGLVLLAGSYHPAAKIPAEYVVHYLGIRLPEAVLFGAVLSAGLAIRAARRSGPTERRRLLPGALLAFSIAFPIVYLSLGRAPLYDGIRHLLFLVPLLCAAAGIGLAWGLSRAWHHGRAAGGIAAVAAGLYLTFHASLLVRLHPYQYIYYNQLVGGVQHVSGLYELDYWGATYAEAVRGMVELAGRSPDSDEPPYGVRVCGPQNSVRYYLPPGFRVVFEDAAADFYIAHTRLRCHTNLGGKPVFAVERLGVPLSYVIDRREIRARGRRPASP